MGGTQVSVVEYLYDEYMADALYVEICGDTVRFNVDGDYDAYNVDVSREEAIAAARAILAHYGEE